MRTLLFAFAAIALGSPLQAQTLELAGTASPAGGSPPRFEVALRDLRSGATTATLSVGGYPGAVQIGLDLQQNDTFGPAGNIVFELGGRLATDGSYQGRLAVRGVVGPVALSAALSAFNAPPEAFAPLAYALASRPITAVGEAGFGLELTTDIRASSELVIGFAPDLYLLEGRLAARLATSVTLLRALPEVDAVIALEGYGAPGFDSGHAALGVGAVWRRRRAPAWDGTLWLGVGGTTAPGFSGRLAQRLGSTLLSLDAAAQPYRLDVAPYRLHARAAFPLGEGEAEVGAAVGYRNDLQATVRFGVRLPLER